MPERTANDEQEQGAQSSESERDKSPGVASVVPSVEIQQDATRGQMCKNFLRIYWRALFTVCWPLILTPFLFCHDSAAARCAYVVCLMAGFWVTEAVSIAITSLIPIFLFPVFGVLSTAATCACYMNDTIMVFIGGLILAIATEHCNLHMRIALLVMHTLGCSHAKLLAGLCMVTTFISMWIANAAATAMMVPIVFAVLHELERQGLGKVYYIDVDPERPDVEVDRRPTNVTKAYLFAAAYASTFGGTGTLVGTPTNLAFKGIFEFTFPEADMMTFGEWMAGNIPQMAVNSAILWVYLRVAFLGFLRPNSRDARLARIGPEGERIANEVIREKLKLLGPMRFHELGVCLLFATCILLWVFRSPGFVTGWADALPTVLIQDSTPVVMICILMFFVPKEPKFLYSYSSDPEKRPRRSSDGLITWEVIQTKMPWGLVFLLGGGFAISRGSSTSCLAMIVGQHLVPLKNLPPVLMLALVILFVGTMTELTSNVGTANILLPVVAHMCVAMKIHPLYLMIPTTLTCSYAFRLPVSTPPNAIITVIGKMKSSMLLTGGCPPAIYSLVVQVILFPTWGTYMFGIKGFPAWAESVSAKNSSSKCPTI